MPPPPQDEEELLRSVTFQNAQAILLARERAERELRESNERTRDILESITDAFIVLDKDWCFTHVNRQAEQILLPLKKSRASLIGKNFWEEFPDLLGSIVEENFYRAVADKTKVEFEVFYLPLNSWFQVRAYPAREGLSVYFLDATAGKEAQDRLRHSEEELRALANSIPQLAWMADSDGHIFWYNRGWYDYTGTTLQEMQGWGWKSVHDPKILPEVLSRWEESIRTGTPFEMEFPLRRADGVYRWFLTRVKPVSDSEGHFTRWFGTNTDIDDQRQLVQSLSEARDHLERRVEERTAQLKVANESLRKLSASLLRAQDAEQRHLARELHDSVGQLLAAIGMNISVIQAEADKLSPAVAKCVVDNGELLQEIIKEIRTISHLLHPPMLDEAGLAFALKWYVEGFAERSKVTVNLAVDSDLGRLPSDTEIAIFRIVQECLTNIHRHSASSTAAIRIHREADNLIVQVQDSGKGISKEKQRELIESDRGGVGFAGMRERVRQLGGTLEIQSGDGGTVVSTILKAI